MVQSCRGLVIRRQKSWLPIDIRRASVKKASYNSARRRNSLPNCSSPYTQPRAGRSGEKGRNLLNK